ncbi:MULTISPECIES: DUF2971 domain-containing protein [Enterobacter]|uniref:DUF2971 domain-containing protein n=1 Tax=Enterobacter hormaechei TaxID=158836 RepID=UPI00228C2B90|nr:DUF2971 domain-containing protein [Enterobacter hormaechei]ELC6321587.1 DUF2971 domain-containing protein [Enterobacter hormaechei]MDV2198893.1 DUF2971 domain-containing protein [Enterobacter hormaechei]WNP20433.1 DUF2971 domain-containing protein [Enterobacter hormaechei]HCR0234799.1 DUF2971 domain-containing protein [Enterobacter hormaechei]HCT5778622.1 DUF2971 domain-containing protein [Enterobacter hormaechei]
MILSSATHIFRFRGDNINTINELVNNAIWHSKNSILNDPFDMFYHFDKESLKCFDKSDISTLIDRLDKITGEGGELRELLGENELGKIYQRFDEVWGDGFASGFLIEFQKNVAVASFTKNYNSRLMWGYYGNGMKGICFAYNRERLKESGIELFDVTYDDKAPRVDFYKYLLEMTRGEPVSVNFDFALVKHSDWEREDEVRSLHFLDAEAVYEHQSGIEVPLQGCCIDAIIIGERLSGDMRVFIENFAKKNGIEIMTAKADFTNYKIQLESK